MKPRRRVVTAKPSGRRPTVRRIKPALGPVAPKVRPPEPLSATRPASSRIAPLPPGTPGPREAEPEPLDPAPVGLEVDLGRGLVLANPVLGAAGVFSYGVEVADAVPLERLGAICTRSTTVKARGGNAAPRMTAIEAGLLNAVGLQNPGIDAVVERYAPVWRTWAVPVIVSVAGGSVGEYVECARRLEAAPAVAAIELNLSCPNASRGGLQFALDADAVGSVVGAVRRATDLPILAKLSPNAADVRGIARAAADAGADAITAVNTLTGLALAPDRTRSALGAPYGGISGPALRPVALRVVFEVAQAVDIPVVAAGGVASIDDLLDFLAVGAVAVQVGTAALADPALPVRLVDDLVGACRERGLDAYAPLVGTALPRRATPPSIRGAEYRP